VAEPDILDELLGDAPTADAPAVDNVPTDQPAQGEPSQQSPVVEPASNETAPIHAVDDMGNFQTRV
jgi:hypothetical protein